jgi:ribonuclease D
MPTEFPASISREMLNALPVRRYDGPIHWIDSAAALRNAGASILSESVIGFDTETRPAFRKGEHYRPSLVQVATREAVFLFPLTFTDAHGLLKELLNDPAVPKSGVALAYDLRTLGEVFPFDARSIVDLGHVAKRHGCTQTGLRNLTGMFLGFRIPKGAKTTNWAAPQLSEAQRLYAATDAWVCRELYCHFENHGLITAAPAGSARSGVN